GLVDLAQVIEALAPQLHALDPQLLGRLGLADLEGLFDVLQTGLEMGPGYLALPLEHVAQGFGPLLLKPLHLLASRWRCRGDAWPQVDPVLEHLLLQLHSCFRRLADILKDLVNMSIPPSRGLAKASSHLCWCCRSNWRA